MTTSPRGGLSQSKWLLALAALIILAVSGVGIFGGFGSSKTATPATNAFVVSGSLRGTLKVDPNLNCGRSARGSTQLGQIAGTLHGSTSERWTIVIATPQNGTFRIDRAATSHSGASVTLTSEGAAQQSWSATKGSVTIDDSTGSFNVTAAPLSGTGTVTIKGGWECPA